MDIQVSSSAPSSSVCIANPTENDFPSGIIKNNEWFIVNNGRHFNNHDIFIYLKQNEIIDVGNENHDKGSVRTSLKTASFQRDGKWYINIGILSSLLQKSLVFKNNLLTPDNADFLNKSIREAISKGIKGGCYSSKNNNVPMEIQMPEVDQSLMRNFINANNSFRTKTSPDQLFMSFIGNKKLTLDEAKDFYHTAKSDPQLESAIKNNPGTKTKYEALVSNITASRNSAGIFFNGAKCNPSSPYSVDRSMIDRTVKIDIGIDQSVRLTYIKSDGTSGYLDFDNSNASISQANPLNRSFNMQLFHAFSMLPEDITEFQINIVNENNKGDKVIAATSFTVTDVIKTDGSNIITSAEPLYAAVANDIKKTGMITAESFVGPVDGKNQPEEINLDDINFQSFKNPGSINLARGSVKWNKTSEPIKNSDGSYSMTLTATYNTNDLPASPIKDALVDSGREELKIKLKATFFYNNATAATAFSERLESPKPPRFVFYNGHKLGGFGGILGKIGNSTTPVGVGMFCCNSNTFASYIGNNIFPVLTTNKSDPSGYTIPAYFDAFLNSSSADYFKDVPMKISQRVIAAHIEAKNDKDVTTAYFEGHYVAKQAGNDDKDHDGIPDNIDPGRGKTKTETNGDRLTYVQVLPDGSIKKYVINKAGQDYRNQNFGDMFSGTSFANPLGGSQEQ